MRARHLLAFIIPLSSVIGCASTEAPPENVGQSQATITSAFCFASNIGAPCDPDGSGVLKECDGVCAPATGGFGGAVCVKVSVAGENNGKVCGKTTEQKSDCNQTCVGSDCVSGAKAADGVACKPSDGSGYYSGHCDGQCSAGSCVALSSSERCVVSVATCQASTCDPKKAKSCIKVNASSGVSCNDSNDCTTGDHCDGSGKCIGSGTSPADTPCTATCYAYGSFADAGAGRNGKCNSSGTCIPSTSAIPAGSTGPGCFGSGDLCNVTACDGAGKCGTTPKCPASTDPCKAVSCDPTSGGCITSYTTSACTYSDKCYAGVCASGACTKGAFACDDSDPCTVDACDSTGTCSHAKKDCDDKDPCTADSCDSAGVCQHTPIGGCGDAGPGDTGTDAGGDTGTPPADSGTGTDSGTESDSGSPPADTGTTPADTGGGPTSDSAAGDSADGGNEDAPVQLDSGCGCRTQSKGDSSYAALALAGVTMMLARRRRR